MNLCRHRSNVNALWRPGNFVITVHRKYTNRFLFCFFFFQCSFLALYSSTARYGNKKNAIYENLIILMPDFHFIVCLH